MNAGDPVGLEQGAYLDGRLLHHGERDTGRGVEVDAQLVRVVRVGSPVRPGVEPETAEVGRPQDVGDVGHHDGP